MSWKKDELERIWREEPLGWQSRAQTRCKINMDSTELDPEQFVWFESTAETPWGPKMTTPAWAIYYGPSKFLICEGSGWSMAWGSNLFEELSK